MAAVSTGQRSIWAQTRGLVFPVLIVASVLVIISPMPVMLMDLLLAANITLAVVILLTTIYVKKPLEFSVFPSVLLGTTLARLVLNIIPEGGKALIAHFGKGAPPGASAFEGLAVRTEDRLPPVLEDAHAYLDCRVVDHVDAGPDELLRHHGVGAHVGPAALRGRHGLVVVEQHLQVRERHVRPADHLDHAQELGLPVRREPARDDRVAGERHRHAAVGGAHAGSLRRVGRGRRCGRCLRGSRERAQEEKEGGEEERSQHHAPP